MASKLREHRICRRLHDLVTARREYPGFKRICGEGKTQRRRSQSRWVLLDVETGSEGLVVRPQFIRVAHDVELAAKAIEQSPLPNAFAMILRTGGV